MARWDGTSRVRLLWRVNVAIYLPYFAVPAYDLFAGGHPPERFAIGAVALVTALVSYVPAAWNGVFRPDDRADPIVRIAVCAGLGIVATSLLGLSWAGLLTYAAHLAGGSIRRGTGWAIAAVLTITVAGALTVALVTGDPVSTAWGAGYPLVAGLVAVGFGWLASAYRELDRARVELARLAVADERLRFARDLHDLLGHSLSVIALKSDLAGRLIERDPARAAVEVRDIEAVTREALAEVRAAVTGYRTSVDLAAELDRARSALTAAGVDADIDLPAGPLPAAVQELLAWTVREGTTNIVRHAGARRASIRVCSAEGLAAVEVVDDGAGRGVAAGGNGLDGLAERVAAAAGEFEAGDAPGGGFRLAVRVSL